MRASRSENSRASGKASSYLLAGAALLTAAAFLLGPINRTRNELQLRAHGSLSKNLPPDIALAQAGLGTFRALATSVLWSRATRLQNEGSHFEALRLADWITRLQPRFSAVWSFQAWNMAFNISLATELPAERWLWVREGVALLRDRGIPLNPREIDLYRELSHIFLRKLSGSSDAHHLYYQRQLATRWQALLGPPPEKETAKPGSWLQPVAEAYELYLESPGNGDLPLDRFLSAVPRAAELITQLETIGAAPGREVLREVAAHAPGKLAEWIERNKEAPEYASLLAFLRARSLAKDYNMDPRWMLALVEGDWVDGAKGEKIPLPLDWRLPEAHCGYWASLGLHRSRSLLRPDEYASFYCRSNLLNALNLLKDTGQLTFERGGEIYRRLPAPEFAPALAQALKIATQKYPGIYPEPEASPPAPSGK